jgi:ferredoxin like protein
MAIEDKLSTTRFNVDAGPHIRVNTEICAACSDKPCLYVCPVQNFVLRDDKLEFSWQGCLECGACRTACSRGAIDWNYPRGGFGVCWRYG